MMCYDHNSFNCYFWIFYAQNKLCRLYTTILCPLLYVILGSILCFPLLNVLVSLWKLPGLCMAIVCSHFGQMLVLACVALLFMQPKQHKPNQKFGSIPNLWLKWLSFPRRSSILVWLVNDHFMLVYLPW